MRPLSGLLLLILTILVSFASVRAEIYVVDPFGTGDFPTIQAAINDILDGDVIALTDGTFEGQGNRGIYFWNKSIKILSISGDPSRTIIDCGGLERAFHIGGPDESGVSLEWLTIRQGSVEGNSGGAIRCWNSSPSFVGLLFTENEAVGSNVGGGAVFCQDSSPTFVDVVFDQNRTLGDGSQGGGILVDRGSATFERCIFSGNLSTDGGGGAFTETEVEFVNCVVSGNSADNGGGFNFDESSVGVLEGCRFEGNVTESDGEYSYGGAVNCFYSDLSLIGCDFIDNECAHYSGMGGAIVVAHSTTEFVDCTFSGNTCADRGGAIYHTGDVGSIEGCTFESNQAVDGGAIFFHTTPAAVSECRFTNNSASGNGGAVRIMWESPSPSFDRCIFEWNSGSSGGAISLWDSQPVLTSCTFYRNQAPQGAGVDNRGGVVQLLNTIIAFNEGVAVNHWYTDAVTLLSCCDIYGNSGGPHDVEDQIGANGNFAEDPLFCDPVPGDLTLQSNSPCAAENNPECGLIGALPVGCGPTAIQEGTWGTIKAAYR